MSVRLHEFASSLRTSLAWERWGWWYSSCRCRGGSTNGLKSGRALVIKGGWCVCRLNQAGRFWLDYEVDSKTTLLVLTSHLLQWLHHMYAPFFAQIFLNSISRDPFRRDLFPSWTIWAYMVICHYLHWKMYIFLCIQKLDMEIEFKAFQTRYRKREGVWMTFWPMLGLHSCSFLSPSFLLVLCAW